MAFLRPSATARFDDVIHALEGLWARYRGLKDGRVSDLERLVKDDSDLAAGNGANLDFARVPPGRLHVLMGIGAPLFTLAGRGAGAAATPKALTDYTFGQAAPGLPITGASAITYEDASTNLGEAVVAFQFTAISLLPVERAVVETWKYLWDHHPAPLEVQAMYTGAARNDGRSWIDFHDGASNLSPKERMNVIVIPEPESEDAKALPPDALRFLPSSYDEWTSGGTYLAFMRLYIDMEAWRRLDYRQQEALVGRRKLTGFPLLTKSESFPGVKPESYRRSRYGRPPHEADWKELNVAVSLDPEIELSHVQRANHHNPREGGSMNPLNHRVFRQGYSFLEPQEVASGEAKPPFRAGLNFVSFQWTPVSLMPLLSEPLWLGGANFGGADGSPSVLTARAAGLFLVPPWAKDRKEPFPGRDALTG